MSTEEQEEEAYCSADYHLTFLDTPDFMSYFLHRFGCVALPIHAFGAYCILLRTPAHMSSVKWSLLNFHCWSCFVDLALSLLTAPFVVLPILGGYPTGLLTYFGMDINKQTLIMISSTSVMLVSIVGIFENRFLVFASRDHWWRRIRIPYLALNYIYASTYFLVNYYRIPDDQIYWKQFVLRKLPCLAASAKAGPLIVLSDSPVSVLIPQMIIIWMVLVETFVFFNAIHSFLRQTNRQLSRKTVDMQRQFMRALSFQLTLPLLIVEFPLFFIISASVLKYHNQALNNVSFILIASHGFFSTLAILSIHGAYREVVLRMVRTVLRLKPSEQGRGRGRRITQMPSISGQPRLSTSMMIL